MDRFVSLTRIKDLTLQHLSFNILLEMFETIEEDQDQEK